jgi:hypothetical protein
LAYPHVGLRSESRAKDGEKDGPQSEPTPSDHAPSPSPQTPRAPEPAPEPVKELAPAPKRDNPPQTAPDQATPTPEEAAAERRALYALNEQTAPDGDADLPTNFERKRQKLSLDEKVGNLIFLLESQIDVLVPEVRAAGRLPELYRRCRKVIDKLEAEAAADDGDRTEAGAEPAAVDRATPVQKQMPPTPTSPDLPPAA